MHEVAVMSSIMQSVITELERNRASRAEEVTIVIGEMTFLGEDQLRFAFEVLSQGTPLEGAALEFVREPAEVLCRSCGYSGGAAHAGEDEHLAVPVL